MPANHDVNYDLAYTVAVAALDHQTLFPQAFQEVQHDD